MKKTLALAIFSLIFISLFAQHEPIQPFEDLGVKVKILTLSNGKYQETFSNDTVMRIGSVMYHRFTGEVVAVVEADTLYGEYSLQPEVMSRWLSPDPLAAKYPNWSPYAYAFNNPIIFIDPDGRDNIIYLVALEGANKQVNVNKVVENANKYYNNLGVKTQVVLFNGKVEDLKNIDKTDAVAVLGSSKEQISDFVQNNLSEVSSEGFRERLGENWENSNENPERSENNEGKGGNVIAINAADLKEAANNFLSTKAEAGAFLLAHGSGHTAGLNHDSGYTSLMSSGKAITAMIQGSNGNPLYNTRNECYSCIQDFTNTRSNDVYLKHFMSRFGNNKPNPKLNK